MIERLTYPDTLVCYTSCSDALSPSREEFGRHGYASETLHHN